MERIKRIVRYLLDLEWTERVQDYCIFCDRANLGGIAYEDDDLIAIHNLRPAGQMHWLIMPKLHLVRDIEALNGDHVALLQAMDRVKHRLLRDHCPAGLSPSDVHSGYHRGRRPLPLGRVYYPDVVSVHHLHLHVIVRPRPWLRAFKYPRWLPLMWRSDRAVMRRVSVATEVLDTGL
ncbi:hypothetical protein F4809DRAFT_646082 [Biscogniauxia mediterranea]|nr:hypothetical protein F4809DRAFT_646082 [Biscogniauxia mediterranea]